MSITIEKERDEYGRRVFCVYADGAYMHEFYKAKDAHKYGRTIVARHERRG